MAGWSILNADSDLDCIEILRNLQSSGFCVDIDASSVKVGLDGNKDKLRCLFHQILTVFLKEISLTYDIRPVPAMIGDGRPVDLLKLFCVVRERGGYDFVSKKTGLWCLVAEECGFSSEFASAIKLIYIKYLDTLDRWVRDKGIGGGFVENAGNMGVLSMGLGTELKDLLSDTSNHDHEMKDEESIQLDSEDIENMVVAGTECIGDKDEMVLTSECSVVNEENSKSRKRKREVLSGMLNWVTEIAKKPGDPATAQLLKFSRPNGNGNRGAEFHRQILKAREALLHRRNLNLSADRLLLQKKQKMHPSIYEDQIGANELSAEGLRCSPRLFSRMQSHSSHSNSKSSGTSQTDLDMRQTPSLMVKHPTKQSPEITDSLVLDRGVYLLGNDHLKKWVRVGAIYQAEVPEWTVVASESDSKWLGRQHWPLPTTEKRSSLIERDPIGKGRQDSCGCLLRDSAECIRFHITEKRMRMKLELGSAFYNWRFFCMGEEVSLAWKEEEEKKFKAIMRLNPPSLNKCFWDEAMRCFPSKKRHGLVSYYFNVLLLRRRSYQNRVTPNNIDSDDDESEFGSVSNDFGHEAVKVPGSKSIFCAQNKQYIDLE